MYTVAVKRDFTARHFLIGGDWGDENREHSHHYQVEALLEGAELDAHGYLVDIVDIEEKLEELVKHYKHRTLNELPEFAGLNPSIEHFARILCRSLAGVIRATNLCSIQVKIRESDIAWASYREVL